jgi:hypothetical protein
MVGFDRVVVRLFPQISKIEKGGIARVNRDRNLRVCFIKNDLVLELH